MNSRGAREAQDEREDEALVEYVRERGLMDQQAPASELEDWDDFVAREFPDAND